MADEESKDKNETENQPEPEQEEKEITPQHEHEEVEHISEAELDKEPEKEKVPNEHAPKGESKLGRLKAWYGSHKKLSIPLTVIVLLLILFLIPTTRYKVAGFALKQDMTLTVMDSKSNTPVSGATITSGSASAETDGTGKATLHVKVGNQTFVITKKYYKDEAVKILVPILKPKSTPSLSMEATGRQVKISVTNLINRQALSEVTIKAADVSAKTDKDGNALIVLPAGASTQKATLSANGYNDKDVVIEVSDQTVKENDLTLTPAGKIYFLSKLSGKIDLVKTNLDGSARKTVLAGTGNEDDQDTILLANRSWKYLALKSTRDNPKQAKLYFINTSNDKVSVMDEGNKVTFTMIGWYDDNFVYRVDRNSLQPWQPNQSSIKSFNAPGEKLLTLVNTSATGTNLSNANYESLADTTFLGDNLVYTKTWYQYYGGFGVAGKQNTLALVKPDGTYSKVIQSVDSTQNFFTSVLVKTPAELYVQMQNANYDSSQWYLIEKGGILTKTSAPTQEVQFGTQPTYLLSPSDKETFWSDERDGKQTLFTGDEDGLNSKQIGTLSEYTVYGWYTDDYLLVSKDASELYIMPKTGIKKDSDALKITDYHKPEKIFYGYGGGYGGI